MIMAKLLSNLGRWLLQKAGMLVVILAILVLAAWLGREWQRLDGEFDEKEQRWIAQLDQIYPDITKGNQLSTLVISGRETRFYLDDREIGIIDDPEFGPAFLEICTKMFKNVECRQYLTTTTIAPAASTMLWRISDASLQ